MCSLHSCRWAACQSSTHILPGFGPLQHPPTQSPTTLQVAACQSNTLYVINVQTATDILQQIVFNSATSCLGMNAKPLQIASIVNSTVPTDCTDPAYAAQAGIPLPTTYSAPVTEPATSPLNTNPSLGQDAG